MNDKKLLLAIERGYEKARDTCLKEGFPLGKNQLFSAKFVAEVSQKIYTDCFSEAGTLRVIGVDDKGEKRSGEWLLDACITEDIDKFIGKIVFAMESESNTSKKSFNEDFAKILHIDATYSLYLNGLNHRTLKGKDSYIRDRLEYAKKIIANLAESKTSPIYIGFFPSPQNSTIQKKSIWWFLSKEYSHLNQIVLYKFHQGKFLEIVSKKI